MKIIKRSGMEDTFDIKKIEAAIRKANESVIDYEKLTEEKIQEILANVEKACENMKRSPSVEEIQDMVENQIMNQRAFNVARNYITYRYKRALVRKSNSTDEQILSLLECNNEEVKQENSNKNPTVNSVQRDYMAGEVSKDITRRFLLDEDIVEAHEKGIIHFHDADYFAQHMHNCCLVNLEDMLQNGTVISETMIDRPKSFSTACNIATQAIAQIASSQYGGQSISLSHLAPFVDVSRQKFRKTVREELTATGIEPTEEMVNKIAEMRVKEEINRGVQMIQYQVITLMTTNGQAPFVTVFMYLDEVPEGQLRDDLAAVIEEVLHQRIQGVKNEKGVFITPAFPKLIYVLEEDNIREGSKYWYLTKLAAECTAKRMVPDYISEKIMTMSMEEGADYLIDHYGVSLTRTQILDGIRELIRGFYEDEVQLKPGVEQVIKSLASKDIPMIIATSSDSACVTAGLKRLGVWSYFKGILTCSDIGKGKTEPDIYLAAAKNIGSKPSETIVFEDALHAIVTAKNAGFITVGIYDSYNQDEEKIRKVADFYYKNWDEVSKSMIGK